MHFALLEIGVPCELREVDFERGAHGSPEYLKLNPNGVVPTMLVDGEPYYECAALLFLLADRHLDARLSPWPGEPDRALYLQWMVHFANTLQAAFRQWFCPSDFGPPDREADVKASAQGRIEAARDRLDAHLGRRGPFMVGDRLGITRYLRDDVDAMVAQDAEALNAMARGGGSRREGQGQTDLETFVRD